MQKVERFLGESGVYELDRDKAYVIVMNRRTGVEKNKGLHNQLSGAGIKAVILITDDAPDKAVSIYQENMARA